MIRWKPLRIIIPYVGIVLGSVISAYSTQAFIVQAGLGSGGISGIALLLYYRFGLPIGILTFLLNIPLFLLGWREVSKRFVIRTILGLIVFSAFLDLFKGIHPLPLDDVFLGALYGGVTGGIGSGILFMYGGSLGGTSIIAKVINRKFGWDLGTILLAFNIIIIAASWAVLGPQIALYTLVSMYVSSKTNDIVLNGIPAKSVTIISDQPQVLVKRIMSDIGRGATFLHGSGAYSQDNKEIIICVVNLPEIGRLKQVIREVDPKAFMIVQDAAEVVGKGFMKIN